jgi:cell division protein FtsB
MRTALPNTAAKLATAGLVALIVLAQGSLWFGKGSVPYVVGLQSQLAEQHATNEAARERNQRLAAEVGDLREGLEMVEETARRELGMVREHEVLVQYTQRR